MKKCVLAVVLACVAAVSSAAHQQASDAGESKLAAGIYATTASGPVPLTMEMPSGNDMKGGMRPSITYSYTGTSADLRLNGQPEFTFVVPRSKSTTDPQEMMQAGMLMNMRPNQFAVVRLTTDKFDRILDGRKAKKVELEVERLTTDTYRAKPKSMLEAGEYALSAAYGGMVVGQAWTFGVDR